jgi:hypothetical protein
MSSLIVIEELAKFGYYPDFVDDAGNPGLYCVKNGIECQVTIRRECSYFVASIKNPTLLGTYGFQSPHMKDIVESLVNDGLVTNGVPTKGVIDDSKTGHKN